MASTTIKDSQILEILHQLDFEDDEGDPFTGEDTGNEFVPDRNDASETSTSSESESKSPPPILKSSRGRDRSRMRARSHAHYSRRCERTPQFTSARGSSSSDNQFTWAVKNFTKNLPMLSEPSYSIQDRTNFSKLDYFTQYFDDELIDMIVDKTNQTAVYKTGKSLLITNGELKVFISLFLIMACIE
ncbi:uncharacterized protein LOC128201774 [Galleria mellonella]|uniref:Uncharacterized protein LOC128201774 n=1 Tax=Galleria mellonella TaxID=7137 RepID=A0ABM3MWP9_GALME|nr:uncharacterized protein LOC128201774 [Galleria mellonella]